MELFLILTLSVAFVIVTILQQKITKIQNEMIKVLFDWNHKLELKLKKKVSIKKRKK